MPKDWFINQNDKTYGPYPSDRLKELASAGRISPEALVANSSNGPWHSISRIKGLRLTTPSAPPCAPPSVSPPPQTLQVSANHDHHTEDTSRPLKAHSEQLTITEQPVWSGRPSQITNIKTFILCGLFCWLIVPLFVAGWRWLVIRCITYELTTQRFKVSHGVLTRRTDELELYRVKDTSYSQSLFERSFGLASIQMTTSDLSNPVVTINAIGASQAKQLREQIRTLTEELRDRKRVREIDYA